MMTKEEVTVFNVVEGTINLQDAFKLMKGNQVFYDTLSEKLQDPLIRTEFLLNQHVKNVPEVLLCD